MAKLPRAKDLRALPEADLNAQLDQLRREIWQNRLKARDGSSAQTHQRPALKRQIARILTVLQEQKATARSVNR